MLVTKPISSSQQSLPFFFSLYRSLLLVTKTTAFRSDSNLTSDNCFATHWTVSVTQSISLTPEQSFSASTKVLRSCKLFPSSNYLKYTSTQILPLTTHQAVLLLSSAQALIHCYEKGCPQSFHCSSWLDEIITSKGLSSWRDSKSTEFLQSAHC